MPAAFLIGGCFLLTLNVMSCFCANEFFSEVERNAFMEMAEAKPPRYLLYEVNPGEGFNLRRDVYMRLANMVKQLNGEDEPWVLVLPAWSRIYHWKSPIVQNGLPWSQFFDIDSLRLHVPIMELHDWLKISGEPASIDEMYYLQPYKEGWVDGKWTERYDHRPCINAGGYHQDSLTGEWHGHFWDFEELISAKAFACLSVQAEYSTFKNFLVHNTSGRSVMLHRAETLTHGHYSEWSKEFWSARRSMRFAKRLVGIADTFRAQFLDSADESDNTVRDGDWRQQQKALGTARGGPFLAVHLRRRDFLYGHQKDVPSLKFAASQIKDILTQQQLTKVFVATDAPQSEYDEFVNHLAGVSVYRFHADQELLVAIGDGGVAIVDQWICAHAKYFIGTHLSTFSFRIHEERSLLGFDPQSTYNRLCGDNEDRKACANEQPTKWLPQYN